MLIEVTDQEAEKFFELMSLLEQCDSEILILHTYYEEKEKGYKSSIILDTDEIRDYATGKKKTKKDQVIEQLYVNELVEEVFDELHNKLQDGIRNEKDN